MKKNFYPLLIVILVIINIVTVNANEFLVSNSAELQTAINNVQGGDTISVQTGNYGALTISGKNNNSFVTIRANAGAYVVFTSINFNNSSYWNLEGVDIKPRYNSCLLYTSDAADERSSVDLGGRRTIKKKKRTKKRKKEKTNYHTSTSCTS